MPKRRKTFRKFEDTKRQLLIADRKLRSLEEERWSYTKNMLRFGFASWVFSLSVFFLAIVVVGARLFTGAPPIYTYSLMGTPLLVGVPAAPVTITAVSVRKFDTKIKRLKRIRKRLVAKYQKAVLQYVEDVAASRR